MSGKPRVLLVGPFPPAQGGQTTFLLNLTGSYLADDYEFIPFTIARPPKKDVVDNAGYGALLRGGPWRILVGIAVTLYHLVTFPFTVAFRRIDLVQVSASNFFVFWETVLYVAMARLLGRPVLMRFGADLNLFYGKASPRMRRLIAWAYRLPSLLIVQSEYWRNFMAEAGRSEGLVVLNNFYPGELGADRAVSRNGVATCLFIAGLEARRKGIDVLLEAARQLERDSVPVRLQVIGAPPSLARRIEEQGLGGIIEVKGFIDRGAVLDEMHRSDVFLSLSLGEGFPNAMLEAMAQGMAVIATPVGAVPEILDDGDGGFIVPTGDAAAPVDRIRALSADPELVTRMGARNREIVRDRYSPQAVLPNLDGAYRRLLG